MTSKHESEDSPGETLRKLMLVYKAGADAYESLSDDVEKLIDELLKRLEKRADTDDEPKTEVDRELAKVLNTLIEAYEKSVNILKSETHGND